MAGRCLSGATPSLHRAYFLAILLCWSWLPGAALRADQPTPGTGQISAQLAELKSLMQSMQKQLGQQQRRIDVLEKENVSLRKQALETAQTAQAAQTAAAAPAPMQASAGAAATSLKTPEIGLVADMVASTSKSNTDEEGNDRLAVREVELVFGHDVDPYSRLDATIAFSDSESPDLEEAYLTHFGLPASTKLKVGRFHPAIGRSVPLHRDSLDTVDEPLMIQQYFGAEGLSKTGVEISNYLPLPWESVAHELSLALFEGGVSDGATLFSDTRRAPQLNVRLRNSWHINDMNELELSGTYLLGSGDEDTAAEVRAYGVDLTYQHYLSAISKLKLVGEALFQDRSVGFNDPDIVDAARTADGPSFRKHPWGAYGLADLRFAPRWSAGARWDLVQSVDTDESLRDATVGWSSYLSFYQSEFARFRVQYEHLDVESGGTDDRLFLQGTFAIGTHKHQLN